MNYVELHIGDYGAATFHLSPLEDGIYWRLLRVYYRDERPLPVEIAAVERLVGCRDDEDRTAVGSVLAEFFELEADGWHQARCDQVLEAYRVRQGEVDSKRKNEADRQARHREERSRLFAALREYEVVPAWDTPTRELRDHLSRVTKPVTRDITANPSPIPHISPSLRSGDSAPSTEGDALTPRPPRKRATATPAIAKPDGVEGQAWSDYLAVRKAKNLPMTQTALDRLVREAGKGGITLQAAVELCASRGWGSFDASWSSNQAGRPQQGKGRHSAAAAAIFEDATHV